MNSAVLLAYCPDQKGIVAASSEFLYRHKGNIWHFDQHVDTEHRLFFMRAEWDLGDFDLEPTDISQVFEEEVGKKFGMQFRLFLTGKRPKVAIFVSRLSHCLFDILARHQSGEWQVDIPLVISNHADLEDPTHRFGINFHHIPVPSQNKVSAEKLQCDLLKAHEIELVILARYMQILSPEFISLYPQRIINIHHGFLPAFPGAKPYHQAFERGVKIVGATSHYVTEELDGGPIIEQDVERVLPKDSVQDMIRKGQDLEKVVLSRAVWAHLNRRILVHGNRSWVF